MRDDLHETLGLIAQDPTVRVVVFRGAGDRAFCAGADLTEFGTAPSQAIARQVRFERDVWARLFTLPKPTIAAVHGFCLGSGLEIALGCDLRIATPDARFGLPETNLGMIPAAGGTQTMPRVIGLSRALDLLLTGRTILADEALRIGLVNRVTPQDQLFAVAETLASELAQGDPEAVSSAKEAVLRGMDTTLRQGLEIEANLARRLAAR